MWTQHENSRPAAGVPSRSLWFRVTPTAAVALRCGGCSMSIASSRSNTIIPSIVMHTSLYSSTIDTELLLVIPYLILE